ncbi:hypothetical protein Taro_035315 [Colocasia esculenta]|uniref:Uncharacterized protein n=1 Tax=Colocasia esculenta TaxID=4460 RepID=A0A843W3G5_COLES|nr:hypothetical protein [Colocasia esculenta]
MACAGRPSAPRPHPVPVAFPLENLFVARARTHAPHTCGVVVWAGASSNSPPSPPIGANKGRSDVTTITDATAEACGAVGNGGITVLGMRIASGHEPSAALGMASPGGARMRAGGDPARGGEFGGGGAASGPVMGSLHRLRQNGIGEGNVVDVALPRSQRLRKNLTIPTVLTLGRVAAVPLLVSSFYMDSQWATTATTTIFIAAAITDWLDGYIARKMCLGTAFGAFLDPVADKVLYFPINLFCCENAVNSKSRWIEDQKFYAR